MGILMASGLGSKVTSYSYGYSCAAIPMGIPMASCLGRRFPSKLPTIAICGAVPIGTPMVVLDSLIVGPSALLKPYLLFLGRRRN